MIRATLVAVMAAAAAFGQSVTAPLKFEVASIKPVAPSLDGTYMVRMRGDAGRLDYSSVSLKAIIQRACEVQDFQISGPDWMAATRFDVVAKLPADTPRSKVPEMLRWLLAERFLMAVHRETRELPVYALVVGKNGPKMKPSVVDSNTPPPDVGPASNVGLDCGPKRENAPTAGWMINKGPGSVQGHGMNMASLARLLAALLGRPVVDQTGLKGNYDFDLDFALEPPSPAAPADNDGVSLFAAVQSQLGLNLDAQKGPVELIVVDHAEKAPTGN